ncbi:MAG: YybH family protein [Pseudomonadales bacterium]
MKVLRMATLVFLGFWSISFAAAASASSEEEIQKTILAKFSEVAVAWNSGDMDGYLAGYRYDNQLAIYFAGGQLFGAKQVDEFYRGTWSTTEKMGTFDTSENTVRVLSPTVAVLHGQFEHRFTGETILGNYSMVWQFEHTDGWKVVFEHTAINKVIAN